MLLRIYRNKGESNYVNAMQIDTCDFEYQFQGTESHGDCESEKSHTS